MKNVVLLLAAIMMLVATACQKTEVPVPTEKDGEQVWHNTFKKHGVETQVELVSFKRSTGSWKVTITRCISRRRSAT